MSLNNHYATYGTFLEQFAGNRVNFVRNPRTVTPLQPISFYGGMKVIF
jgi:hypothetical protein